MSRFPCLFFSSLFAGSGIKFLEFLFTTLTFLMTGKEKYAEWHKMVHDYSYKHFHDKTNGEWFGYLHRDGTIAQNAKGNLFKGPFHLPRQEWYCSQILNEFIK